MTSTTSTHVKKMPAPSRAGASLPSELHPAFSPVAMSGYSLELWRIKENLIHWDVLFAFGFTSYQGFLAHVEKYRDAPLDPIREILVRLYMLEPEFPKLFVPPPIHNLLDFVFNLQPAMIEEDRKRCSSLLAPLLGRNRGSGYRWLRNKQNDNPVSLPIRKLSAKVFSMQPATARTYFWRAALATGKARVQDTSALERLLQKNGVQFD